MRSLAQQARILVPAGGVLAVLLAVAGGSAGHWAAAALAMVLAPHLLEFLPEDSRDTVRRTAPLGVLALLTFLTLGELALLNPPASRDHAIHYFQTSILVQDLIPSGRLTGWSDRLNNGYPFGDSYPVLGYLWVGAGHLLSGGLLSLRASYALGLLGVWVLGLWGVYRMAALAWREISGDEDPMAHRLPASLAAAAWLLDSGESRQGGWEYTMFHGVWPQLLSTGLWIAGLVWTWRAFQHPSPRRWVLAALLLGGSVLAHPFGLLTLGGTAVVWPLLLLATGVTRDLPPGALRTCAAIHILAVGLAAGWLTSFLASADYMGRSPVLWAPLGELTTSLVTGSLFDHGYLGWVAPLGALGLLLMGLRARVFGRLMVALLCGLLVAGSEESVTVLRLDLLMSGFKNLQFPRYSIALKPLWFAMAGVGAAVVARAMARELATRIQRPLGERVVMAILVGPLVAATLAGATRLMPRPVGSVDTLERSSIREREALLRKTLERERDATDGPLRVAFLRTGMTGATYPLMALSDVGAAVVLDGHIPSVNFRYRVKRRPPSALTALGVTHVLYDGRIRKPDAELAKHLEEILSLGTLHLARFQPDDTSSAPAWFARNAGQVQIQEEGPDHRTYTLESVKSGRRPAILRLLQAPYWRWQARLDGEEVETEEASLFGGVMVGTRIDVASDGTLELTYVHEEIERRAALGSTVVLFVCLAGLFFRRAVPMAERIQPPAARRLSLAMAGLAAVLILAGGARRQQRLLASTWENVPPRRSAAEMFERDLVMDGAYTTWRAPEELCEALQGKDPREGCSRADERPRLSAMYRAPYLYRCVRIVVPPRGLARVFFEPAPDEHVVGLIRRSERRGSGKNIKWRIGTEDPTQRLENDLRVFSVDAGTRELVDVRFSNSSSRPEPICVAAAAFH